LVGWTEVYRKDDDFSAIWKRKDPRQYTKAKHIEKHFPEYKQEKELLWEEERICVLRGKRLEVLREGHDTETAGHPGGRKMYKALRQGFYWTGMKRDIERYTQTCESCQKNKALKKKKRGLLQPLAIPSRV
jgi:Integrase zinc binding domain